jgi:hypothetical protein
MYREIRTPRKPAIRRKWPRWFAYRREQLYFEMLLDADAIGSACSARVIPR